MFEGGKVKMRGIEARRGDTPNFVSEAQVEMINTLANAANLEDFVGRIPRALAVLRKYAAMLTSNQISINDLVITKRLSKSPWGYSHDVFQAIAARQLEKAGFDISAGMTVRYLIVNSKHKSANERVLAAELLMPKTRYDVQKYLDMLVSGAETLFGVFGYTKEKIREQALSGEKQLVLN